MDIRKFFKKPRLDLDFPSPSTSSSTNLNENENNQEEKSESLESSTDVKFVDRNDIANYMGRHLTEIEKQTILINVWKPPSDFKFPIIHSKGRNLRFQYSWLQEYNWLCYSKQENGAFCLPCSIFASSGGVNSRPLGKLVKSKFDNWKKAKEVSNRSYSFFLYIIPTSVLFK